MVNAKFNIILFALLLVFSSYVFSYTDIGGGVCECNTCADCTSAINAGECTEIRLTANINDHAGTCIDDPANFTNKVFDCQGYTIDGDDLGTDYGFKLFMKNNNEIKNCRIQDFYHGIYLNSSSNNNITNSNVFSNTYYGIYLNSNSNNNILTGNNITSNTVHGLIAGPNSNNNVFTYNNASSNTNGIGFYLYFGSSNNNLTNNIAGSNQYGIYLEYTSNNNNVISNTVNSNSLRGIYLYNSSNNNVTNNNATSTYIGIHLITNSNNNTLISNTANSNQHGIYVDSSSNSNNLINNTANSNVEYGIYLKVNSNNNNLTNNTIRSNGIGIYSHSSSNNTFITNTVSLSLQTGIYLHSYSKSNNFTNNNVSSNSQYGFRFSLNSDDNNFINNIANSNNNYGFFVESSSNNLFINNTANSTGNGFALTANANNNNLINNTANSNVNGIVLSSNANNNNITNNNVNLNSQYGIYIHYGLNNKVINNRIYSNGYGVYLHYGSNNNLTNNNITSNTLSGVFIDRSLSNNLTNNNITSNIQNGIHSYGGSKNLFINNTINGNGWNGILLAFNSHNNTINNSVLQNNTQCGINISSGMDNNFTIFTISKNTVGICVASNRNKFRDITSYSNTIFLQSYGAITVNLTNYLMNENNTNLTFPNIDISGPQNLDSSRIRLGSNFVSLNTTANDPFNVTANISFAVSDCGSTITIYKRTGGFSTYSSDIIENGTVYTPSWSQCVGNIFKFTVDSFSGFALNESSPSPAPENSNNENENSAPSISFVSSTTGIVSQNYIEAVVEAEDEDENLQSIEIYLFKDNELQDSKTCTSSPCSASFTSLADGIYQLNATAYDDENANDSTETRTITLDTNELSISFISPTPEQDSILNDGNITVKTSVSDSNYDKTIIQLFKGTETIDKYTCVEETCAKPYELDSGNYSIVATAYDTASNAKEIYREFEVYLFVIMKEENITETNQNESGTGLGSNGKNGNSNSQTGIQDGAKPGSKDSDSNSISFDSNSGETESSGILEVTETNPVASLITFVVNNPIVLTVPVVGAVGIFLLHKRSII